MTARTGLSLRPSAKNDPQDLGNDPGSKAGDNGQHQVGVSRIRQFMPQLPPKHFFPPIGNRSLVSEEMGTVAAKGHDAGRLVGLCLHLLSSSCCGDLPRLALGLLAALSSQVSLYRPRMRRGSLCNRRGSLPN